MSILGDVGDPRKDVAALEPLLDELEAKTLDALLTRILPAIESSITKALVGAFDGLTITISISKK